MAISATNNRASGGLQRGFSLLEVLLVAALVASAGTVTVLSLGGGLDGLRLRSAVREIAGELRHARARAIASGQVQRFDMEIAEHRWTSQTGRRGQWPEALGVRLTGARELQPRAGAGSIIFFADGASSGGRIEFNRGDAVRWIEVAWLTGQVRTGTWTPP